MSTTARRLVFVLLLALLAAFQGQLWLGRGSVPNVRELQTRLAVQQAANQQAEQVNAQLSSELSDLKEGLDAVEERARQELGMVKPNEIFIRYTP